MDRYMPLFRFLPYIYFIAVSVVAIVMTVRDKRAAQSKGVRTPERRLFVAALLGGSMAMYITMQVIRHKTAHKRFMIGLTVMMLAQVAAVAWVAVRYGV